MNSADATEGLRPDWKREHANQAEQALHHDLVQNALSEFADNMGFKREGLPEYGLTKIVSYAAQVARAHALGFDPDLLRLTDEEADAQALAKARIAVAAGKPVLRIDDHGVTRLD
jgi:hypothetical protein